ncbi:MAG: hypothetical protein P8J86_07215 [Phycisphaerales bacterium]|nr:hypothetical protein [Phycisphaerales bacterium]
MISPLQVPQCINNIASMSDPCDVIPDLIIDEWLISAALAVSPGCLHSSQAVGNIVSSLGLIGEGVIIERALLSMQLVASCREMLANAANVEESGIYAWQMVSIDCFQSNNEATRMVIQADALHRAFRSLEVLDPTVCLIAEAAMLGGMTIEEIAIAIDKSCYFVDIQLNYARRLIIDSVKEFVNDPNSLEESRV